MSRIYIYIYTYVYIYIIYKLHINIYIYIYIYILTIDILIAQHILVFINIIVQIKVVGNNKFIVYIKVNQIVWS